MADLLKKPCSCSGNNPNCFKCGGWGYIDSVAESRKSIGQGELAKSTKKEEQNDIVFKRFVIAPKKKTTTNRPHVNQQKFRKKESDNISDYFVNLDKPEKINPKECLFCGYPILRRDIESHIRHYHRNDSKDKKTKIRTALNLLFIMLD